MGSAIALILLSALAIGVAIWQLRINAVNSASEHSNNLAIVLAQQLNNSIRTIDIDLNKIRNYAISHSNSASENDNSLRSEKTFMFLRERLAQLQQAAFIGIVDDTGRLLNTTRHWPPPNVNTVDRKYFQYLIDHKERGIYISTPVFDRIKGPQVVLLSKRMTGANGKFLGAVTVGMQFSYLKRIYSSIALIPDQSFQLLRRDGTVIVKFPHSKDRQTRRIPTTSPWYRLVAQGGGQYRSRGNSKSDARLIAARPLGDYPLVVNVGTSEAAVLHHWRYQATALSAGTLLLICCAAFLLKLLSDKFRRLARSEATIDAALRNMSQGLVMFDAATRLVVCNQHYIDMYGLSSAIVKPGCTLRRLLDHRAATGSFDANEIDKYIAEIEGAVRQDAPARKLTELHDGRVIQILNRSTGDGGWVATHEDVTEKARAEQTREQQKLHLDTALENMSQGLCLFDGARRLIIANRRYSELYGLTEQQTKPGTSLGAILEHRAAAGSAPEDHDAYILYQKREEPKNNSYHAIKKLKNGRYISVVRQPMANGGWVGTHEDVTDATLREESFQLLFERNPIPMWVIDWESMRFLAVNEATIEHYGYSHKRFMSMSVLDLRPAEDRKRFVESLRTERDDGLVTNFVRHLKANGTIIDVCVHSRALRYAGHNARLVAIHDITQTKQAENELRRTKNFLDVIVENAPSPIVVKSLSSETETGSDYRFTLINRAAETLLGATRDRIIGKRPHDILPKTRADLVVERDEAALQSQDPVLVGEHSIERPENGDCVVTAKKVVIRDAGGKPEYLLTLFDDITERKRAEEQIRRTQQFLNTVIEHVPAPIAVKELPYSSRDARDSRFMLLNRAGEELLGIFRKNIIGRTAAELFPPEVADRIATDDNRSMSSDQMILTSEYPFPTFGNGTRLVTARRIAIRDENGKARYLLSVLDDVTARKRAEQHIEHLAHHDVLTGLSNRARFNEFIKDAIDRAAENDEQFAILSIDLDHFKEANDTYGHLVGDELLREVGNRMRAAAEGAFVARLGGDEFIFIQSGNSQPDSAEALVERLIDAFNADFEIDGRQLKLGLSVGVAIYPADGGDEKTLLTNVDAALYQAKAEARGAAVFFQAEMGNRLRERLALQNELQSAIGRNELVLHYQPQKEMLGKVIGFEALVRWQSPNRGLIFPDSFISVVEDSGLIISVGEWVLREACREAASWPQPLTVAVNVSPVQFRRVDLPRLVHSILLESGLSPSRLELEITESVMVNDFSRAVSVLNQLKALGIRIAMDDFGTGYSSLSYLHSFHCDKIKIDRVFIRDVNTSQHSRAIVRAIIGLGQSLNLPVLAEGIETEEQRAYLAREGCDEMQGYLAGRPLPIAAYARLVGYQPIDDKYLSATG